MKILVISDSHMRLEKIIKMYEKEKPDVVMCAGDHCKDGEELSYVCDSAKYYIVRGNCDFFDRKYSDEMIIELEGARFFLAHGHEYGVKGSYGIIEKKGKELNCNVVVFGHTHIQYLLEKEGIVLFNPGAAKDGEYGIINIDKNGIEFLHKDL